MCVCVCVCVCACACVLKYILLTGFYTAGYQFFHKAETVSHGKCSKRTYKCNNHI